MEACSLIYPQYGSLLIDNTFIRKLAHWYPLNIEACSHGILIDRDNAWAYFNVFQFCQPTGWVLSSQRQQPTFFVSVLTDIDADHRYCACLTFYEPVAMTLKPDDEDIDEEEAIIPHHSQMFAPKCLAVISKHDYVETFRVCIIELSLKQFWKFKGCRLVGNFFSLKASM